MFGFIGLLMPLMLLVLVVWAALTILRALTLPRGGVREAVCERCRYGVAGVVGFVCPECGGDYREVGIITPRMEMVRRGSLASALLAWTFLWLLGGVVAWWVSMMFWSFGTMVTTTSPTTTWSQTLTPNTPLYQSIELDYHSDWQSVTSSMRILLTLSDGRVESLNLDPGPMTVVGLEGGERDWSPRVIEIWFAESGLDMQDPAVAAAAAETARVIDVTLLTPDSGYMLNLSHHSNTLMPTGAGVTTVSRGRSLEDSVALRLIVGAVSMGIYAIGVVLMVGRRRRMLRVAAVERAGGAA